MKHFWIWLILGLAVRLVLIPLTLHPDFRAVNLAGYFIAQKGQLFSFYDTISQLPRSDWLVSLYGDNLFIYPPLAYITHGIFNKFFYWAYPQNAFWVLINDIGQLRHTAGFVSLMYFLKLPYLIVDILCFWLLSRYKLQAIGHKLICLWWLNPVVIYVTYMIGQFDIFIALFILLSLIFSAKKPLVSAVMLGLGAGFKPFPLLLLLLLPGNKIKNILVGLGTYLLIIAPWLGSPAFRQYALLANQSDKMFFAKIPISGSQYIPIFLLGLLLVYWWNFYRPKDLPVWAWFSAPLLLFYSVTHFHPQWFIWIMPLLVFGVVQNKKTLFPYVILLLCYFIIVLFFDPSLNFGLFNYSLSLAPLVVRFLSPDLLVSVIRAIFASTAAFIIHVSEK